MKLLKHKGQINIAGIIGAAIALVIGVALLVPIDANAAAANVTGTDLTLITLVSVVFAAGLVVAAASLIRR